MTTFASPPSADTPPPTLTPGGRTAIRVFVVVAAAVAVVGTVFALGATAWGLSSFRVVADEQAIPADTRSLVIDARDAPAAIRLVSDRDATEPRVAMRVIESSRAGDHGLRVTRNGGDTVIAVSGGAPTFTSWGHAGEITVTLPTDMARRLSVTTQQDSGVLFAHADLDTLTASNSTGAVLLSGSARRIDVRTSDADVLARQPISVRESFVARSVDGEIAVDFAATAPRTIDAVTETGDVTLALPEPGPYAVRASGETAQVRVPQTDDPARAAAEVTARTSEGTALVERLDPGRMGRGRH